MNVTNGNYGWGLPIAASTYARDIDFGIRLIHWAMLTIFVLWSIFFVYLLIRYKRREGIPAEREPEHHGIISTSLIPDILVMVFEIGLIFFYALPVWSKIKTQFPAEKDANRIDIIAEQFAWNVHYPGADGKFGKRDLEKIHFSNPIGLDHDDPDAADDIVIANEIHVPLGKPTLIRLTSKDVIHSFWIPEFRIKQDAVPGMTIPVWVEPDRAGVYELSCAQLCGFAHSLMRAEVVAQTPEDYEAWLKKSAPALTAAASTKPSESW
jgi:cytochrome c oxidase subunit 2